MYLFDVAKMYSMHDLREHFGVIADMMNSWISHFQNYKISKGSIINEMKLKLQQNRKRI